MKKNFIRIILGICVVLYLIIFGYYYYNYRLNNKVALNRATEILSQIDYIKDRENDSKLITTLKDIDKLKVSIGDRPSLYKSRQDIIAVLNDGTEVEIFLYTGNWSFSIETIKGWHFRTDIWLEPVTFENNLNQ